MSTFTQAAEAIDTAPARTVVLPPSAWKEGPSKPKAAVTLGLRVLSEGDALALRKRSYETAKAAFPELGPGDDIWDEHYNQTLMLGAAVVAVCSPEDRTKPWHPQQYTLLPAYLAPGGLERIWDELEELTITSSPTAPEITAEELAQLRALLGEKLVFEHLQVGDARAARRLLRRLLDRLREGRDAQ